jgi:cbb3-type cytochrome oxidase subunit 3
MGFVWWTIAVVLLIVWVLTLVDIFRRPLSTKQTVAWVLIVLIVPFIGAIVYWAMRKPEAGEAEYFAEADAQRRYEAQHRPFDSTRP